MIHRSHFVVASRYQQLSECVLTILSVFYRVLQAQMEKMANPDFLAPLAPLVPLDSEE